MDLIDKIQRQLDDNHYIEAEDIQKLIDAYKDKCYALTYIHNQLKKIKESF